MAEAVSLRKGTLNEHQDFRGVEGEITYDTTTQTIWVHAGGDNAQKGKPLAREDCSNINTKNLAEGHQLGKNLMYNDLSNITPVSGNDANKIRNALSALSYVTENQLTTQIDTRLEVNLNNITDEGIAKIKDISKNEFVAADLNNLNTSILAGDISGLPQTSKPMAYKNQSNVNTADLATGANETGKHLGKNLMYTDLSNLPTLSSDNLDNIHAKGIETTENIVDVNNATTATQYPTALSVKNKINSLKTLPDTPVVDTEPTTYASYNYQYTYTATLVNGGTGYNTGDIISIGSLRATVESIDDSTQAIITVTLNQKYGKNTITETNVPAVTISGSGSGAIFNLASSVYGNGQINWTSNINALLPVSIVNIIVTPNTGIVTVTTNKATTNNPTIRKLIGGVLISGSWTATSETIFAFTPDNSMDTLQEPWMVTL